ncbi:MAG: beta-N-acetylhexosaminidase [Acidocella sp.]|nr:beta-N-acetylhexosaminidase [Acidocella sp.]NNM56391.1 beta-N-acetylhexosaminidase [Acidocella sp.]
MKPAILGISGLHLLPGERALLRAHRPRGVILFSRNIQDTHQLSELTAQLREALPPGAVLMVDQEGGRVARLRPPNWPAMPAAGTLKTPEAAYAQGLALGQMVRAAGFDVAAAPVLDLRHPGASDIIGDRAFSSAPQVVAQLGAEMARGIIAAGVIPVMKHIPGHGRAMVDSHLALPRVDAADLSADFYPFAYNNNLPWAMTAHVIYEHLDPQNPATISPTVIRDIIRGEIGFSGTLVSDDLAMHALSGSPAERALAALAAGCDIALYCPGDMAGNTQILEALGA